MNIKKTIKKLLFYIKLQINKLPILRNILIFFLNYFPSLYSKLQNINANVAPQKEEKAFLTSSDSRHIFNDIKHRIHYT